MLHYITMISSNPEYDSINHLCLLTPCSYIFTSMFEILMSYAGILLLRKSALSQNSLTKQKVIVNKCNVRLLLLVLQKSFLCRVCISFVLFMCTIFCFPHCISKMKPGYVCSITFSSKKFKPSKIVINSQSNVLQQSFVYK